MKALKTLKPVLATIKDQPVTFALLILSGVLAPFIFALAIAAVVTNSLSVGAFVVFAAGFAAFVFIWRYFYNGFVNSYRRKLA